MSIENEYKEIRDMVAKFSDAEVGRMTAVGGMTVGQPVLNKVIVATTDGNTDTVGTITLIATPAAGAVSFNSASTFNKGITVQAMIGISLSQSLTTKNTPTVLSAGTAALTIKATFSLDTTNQLLVVTANDVDFSGTAVSTGTGAVTLSCYVSGRTLGVGSGSGQFSLSGNEMGVITSNGMTMGGPLCGSQTVTGVNRNVVSNIPGSKNAD